MFPTLYHFIYYSFGISIPMLKIIPMFGFWVGISFMVAYVIGRYELKRKYQAGEIQAITKELKNKTNKNSDLIISTIFVFFIGFKIFYLIQHQEYLEDFRDFLFTTKGNFFAGIILAGAYYLYRNYISNKKNVVENDNTKLIMLPQDHMGNVVTISILGGISGAILFAFLEDPVAITKVGGNIMNYGLTIYGGIIVAAIANIVYFVKNKLKVTTLLDTLSPLVMLSYGIGRIGCHLSGDGDWGIVNKLSKPNFIPNWLWSSRYPNNVIQEGIPIKDCIYNDQYCTILPEGVFPTPLYETIMSVIIFLIIWKFRKKLYNIPLLIFSIYILLAGIERLLIEQIRVNVTYSNGFTQAEIISVIWIILGLGASIFLLLKNNKSKNKVNI